jgi:hypothetical protein
VAIPGDVASEPEWLSIVTAKIPTLVLAGHMNQERWWREDYPIYCQPSGIAGEDYQLTVEAVPWPSATGTPSPTPTSSTSATTSATRSPSRTPLAGNISPLRLGVNGTVQRELAAGAHSFFVLDDVFTGGLPDYLRSSAQTRPYNAACPAALLLRPWLWHASRSCGHTAFSIYRIVGPGYAIFS